MDQLVRLARAVVAATAVALLALLGIAGPAQAEQYAQIEGNGSTWSEVILKQWISDVNSSGMMVTYSGGGSSQGRKSFANNVTDFGISEIPYQGTDEYGNADTSNGREFAYMPIVAGGTAFTYQLRIGSQQVRNLRLSGATLAGIFTNKITNWNDPAIAKDNNGRKFPNLAITPVVRSDGSGTTAQLTTYFDKEYPSVWRPFFGKSGLTSYFPRRGRALAVAGSDQVMNTIASASGNGTIGYVEYSYPVNKRYPVVKVLNRGGYYVEPTQYNTAVALQYAKINRDKRSSLYLTQVLDGVYRAKDARAYPLSSYSYLLLPTGKKDRRMTTAKRQTLADFLFYSLCEGQTKAGPYGYSPLPLNLVQASFDQIKKLGVADPKVNLKNRDVRRCHNPTFDGRNLSSNKLAKIAPMPASCDRRGQGPCNMGTGTGESSTNSREKAAPKVGTGTSSNSVSTSSASTASDAANGPGGPGSAADSPGAAGDPASAPGGPKAAPDVDPETGQPVAAPGTDPNAAVASSVPAEVTAGRGKDKHVFAGLAVLELLALVLGPGLLALWLKHRAAGA